MRRSREIACRFELDPKDCDWLIATLGRLGAAQTRETETLSLHIDTRDAAIGNLGLSLGLRHNGEATADAIKKVVARAARDAPTPGWTRFPENLSAATPAEARRRLGSLLRRHDVRGSLGVIFKVEAQERLWSIAAGSVEAEVNLERAQITADGKEVLFAVVTFGQKAGSAADFLQLVREICAPAKLRISAEGVALHAYRVFGMLRAPHVTAFVPKLAASMDTATAFRTIARAAVDQFLLNETGVRLTRDREALHQCRVALRRLSTCLRLFSSLVSGAGRDDFRLDLKQLAEHLQAGRDLDVLIARVIEPRIGRDAPAASKDLRRLVEARRSAAYDKLVAALSTPHAAKLFLRLVAWIEAGDWADDPERESRRLEPIASFAERKLVKATSKFKERCDKLEEANEEERHRTRIRAKNLRYSAEFFETLAAPTTQHGKAAHHKMTRKRFHAFISALKDLQTILGDENDVRMARHFFASLGQDAGGGRSAKPSPAAIDVVAGGIDGLSEPEFRKKAADACRTLAGVKPFWDKLASRGGTARR